MLSQMKLHNYYRSSASFRVRIALKLKGLEAFKRQLAQLPAAAFCHGSAPTLADCCLVPQLFNAARFNVNVDGLPRTLAVYDACMALPAFQRAQPSGCPDSQP